MMMMMIASLSVWSDSYRRRYITALDLIDFFSSDLIRKLYVPEHSLHHLLRPLGKCNNLWDRGHQCELPEFSSNLHKKSFIVQAL